MNAAEIEALVKLIEDLEPPAVDLIKSLIDKLSGATPEQIAAIATALNATAIQEIDAELGTTTTPPVAGG
jgi:hypothetical protein